VSANKTDISQIRKYLNGELDAKAMHRLEREAQDDPFLMDALEGFEAAATDQQANLADLQQHLAKRVAPKKERSIILWRVLPLAASLLIALSIGYWFLQRETPFTKHYTQVGLPEKVDKDKDAKPMDLTLQENRVAPVPKALARKNAVVSHQPVQSLARQQRGKIEKHEDKMFHTMVPIVDISKTITFKGDTMEYKASAYPVKSNATVDELLKKMEGMEVGSDGNVTNQGQAISKVRVNGKDYYGGNVATAIKNLPADVIDKVQVIDDYGDMANRSSFQSQIPPKILNITTDTSNKAKAQQFAKALQGHLPGAELKEVQVRGAATPSKKEFSQSAATIQAKDLSTLRADSVTSLAEVVVNGYPDKTLPGQKAQPLNGWKAYLAYVVEQAVMPDGAIGKVKLAFTVGTNGKISGIRVVRGRNPAMNQKAIAIIQNGPRWIGEPKQKEIKLKIRFHKKTNG